MAAGWRPMQDRRTLCPPLRLRPSPHCPRAHASTRCRASWRGLVAVRPRRRATRPRPLICRRTVNQPAPSTRCGPCVQRRAVRRLGPWPTRGGRGRWARTGIPCGPARCARNRARSPPTDRGGGSLEAAVPRIGGAGWAQRPDRKPGPRPGAAGSPGVCVVRARRWR